MTGDELIWDCRLALDTIAAGILLVSHKRLGFFGYGFADVEVYARQGRIDDALANLRQAIDQGLRMHWWTQAERSPHTVTLHDQDDFQTMLDEVRRDMSVQLARLQDLEPQGRSSPLLK